MAGRRDNDQSTFRITLEVDNDSALPKLLEGRVSTTLDFNTLCFGSYQWHDLLSYVMSLSTS